MIPDTLNDRETALVATALERKAARDAEYQSRLSRDLGVLIAAATRIKALCDGEAIVSAPLFSPDGVSLIHAMHDITECDALYDMAREFVSDGACGEAARWGEGSDRHIWQHSDTLRDLREGALS